MDFKIRKMTLDDKKEVLAMMKEFYSSNAVHTNGSVEIFENDFNFCINENPYLEGYVFCFETETLGYAMLSKSFSTEYGKVCIWFEDLYLKPQFRGFGIISKFIEHVKKIYPNNVYKLEVEEENTRAVHVYQKRDFKPLPYKLMLCANQM